MRTLTTNEIQEVTGGNAETIETPTSDQVQEQAPFSLAARIRVPKQKQN